MAVNFDEQFERDVLTLCISDQNWFVQNIEFIEPRYFDVPEHVIAVETIKKFYGQYETIPEPKVLRSLFKKSMKGEMLTATNDALDAAIANDVKKASEPYITESLREFVTSRKYRDVLLEGSELLLKGDLSSVRSLFDAGVSFGESIAAADIDYFSDYSVREKRDATVKIPTLFRTVDEKMNGGLSRKELGIILMPPYKGKSVALVNLGTNALMTGKNVLHVTVEMSAEKTKLRYDSCISNLSYNDIERSPKVFAKRVEEFLKLHKGRLFIKEWPARSVGVTEIGAYLKTIARKHGVQIDLLVLDYVDELKRLKQDNMSYAIGDTVANLRGLTSKANIGCWTASQTTRTAFAKTSIDLDDFADSWDKAKVADVVIAGCQTKEEEDSEEMRWIILKNRDNKRFGKPIPMLTKFEVMKYKEK